MIKPALTALLVILSLLLVKENIDTFRAQPPTAEGEMALVEKGSTKKMRSLQPLNLNPQLGRQLPDLSNGYLFNAERFLAKDSRTSKTGKGYSQNIRIEDVFFNGAIIGQGHKKAIVSYSPAAPPTGRTTKPGPQSRRSDQPETIQLEEGDQLGGYTVKEITPDFILFVKGSDRINKTLFDPDKKRQQVAPLPTPSPPPSKPAGVAPARRKTPPAPTRP